MQSLSFSMSSACSVSAFLRVVTVPDAAGWLRSLRPWKNRLDLATLMSIAVGWLGRSHALRPKATSMAPESGGNWGHARRWQWSAPERPSYSTRVHKTLAERL